MALKRKKRFEQPVKCSLCKEKAALHTVHGFMRYGGNTCCDSCFVKVKAEYEQEKERERNYSPTEADYQTWMRL